MSREALITGVGIVSPIGVGREMFLAGLREGRCGLDRLRGLDASRFRVGRGGGVEDSALGSLVADVSGQRGLTMAQLACREALADARIDLLPEDTTLALGTGAGEMRAMEASLGPPEAELPLDLADPLQPPNAITSKLARQLGIRGRLLTFVNACAAGAQAIAVAADLIRSGRAEVAVAGGVEILNTMVLAGFEALRAVSPSGPHPFDADRDGIQLSELAAFLVLESAGHVGSRGAQPYARIAGSGVSADASHVVRPDAEGAGAALALQRALDDAGLRPDEIDYINAHGTGTVQNDPAELAALERVFGERTSEIPISSTKAMLGHALGASGAAEAIICALALREGVLPPTIGLRRAIAGYEDFDFIAGGARTDVRLRHVLSSAFAFGGNNVVLVFSAPVEA